MAKRSKAKPSEEGCWLVELEPKSDLWTPVLVTDHYGALQYTCHTGIPLNRPDTESRRAYIAEVKDGLRWAGPIVDGEITDKKKEVKNGRKQTKKTKRRV